MAHGSLLNQVERFLADTGMAASYFGNRAVGNSKLVPRLRAGRPITTVTADKITAFIETEMKRRSEKARRLLASASQPGAAA